MILFAKNSNNLLIGFYLVIFILTTARGLWGHAPRRGSTASLNILYFFARQKNTEKASMADVQRTRGSVLTNLCSLVASVFINHSSFYSYYTL